MQIDSTVRAHIEKFIALAKKYPCDFDKEREVPTREPERYGYSVEGCKRYVYVYAGNLLDFLVDGQSGQIRDNARRRYLRYGNIGMLLEEKDWKKGLIRNDRNCVPVHHGTGKACEACGRTAGVRPTALGERCQYCRGSDVRHINAIRRLGGTPTLNSKPFGAYLRDD